MEGQADNLFTTNPNPELKLRSVATILGNPGPLCPSQASCQLAPGHRPGKPKEPGNSRFSLVENLLTSPTGHPTGRDALLEWAARHILG